MNQIQKISLTVLAVLAPCASSFAEGLASLWDQTPSSGFYLGGSIGADSMPNISLKVNGFPVTSSW